MEIVHSTKSCWKRQLNSNLLAARCSAASKATEAVSAEGTAASHQCFEAINLPVIITIIDTEEQIKRVLPFLEKNLTHGVATLDDVKMLATDFVKERFEKPVEERRDPSLQE